MGLFGHLLSPKRGEPEIPAAERLEQALAAHKAGDSPQALSLWVPLAEAGEPRALNALGVLYLDGDGVTRDSAHGAMLIARAAEAGQVAAMRNLALLYFEGRGVPQDHAISANWYERAADL